MTEPRSQRASCSTSTSSKTDLRTAKSSSLVKMWSTVQASQDLITTAKTIKNSKKFNNSRKEIKTTKMMHLLPFLARPHSTLLTKPRKRVKRERMISCFSRLPTLSMIWISILITMRPTPTRWPEPNQPSRTQSKWYHKSSMP